MLDVLQAQSLEEAFELRELHVVADNEEEVAEVHREELGAHGLASTMPLSVDAFKGPL